MINPCAYAGYGDVVDGFNGTFDHHLPSATSADKYGDDPMVLEIYIMGANVVVAVAPHELVEFVLTHQRSPSDLIQSVFSTVTDFRYTLSTCLTMVDAKSMASQADGRCSE